MSFDDRILTSSVLFHVGSWTSDWDFGLRPSDKGRRTPLFGGSSLTSLRSSLQSSFLGGAGSMRIDVVTLFPAMFQGVLGESILKIAQEKGVVEIRLVDLRDYTTDKHRKVDAPPYGGGPGMVIMADPVFRAVEKLRESGADRKS